MDKIRLGKTELMVTKLGFGGIPIQRVAEEEAINIVRRALDLGINYIDTANGYTNSEERIGKAIVGRREGLVLATKSSSRAGNEVKQHLEKSLRSLGVESIDLYQFHNVSSFETLEQVYAKGGPLDVIKEARQEGIVKHIGITSHQIDVAKEAVKSGHFETIMFPFNFITHEPASDLLPLAREHDLGFIAMKPLVGGMVTNVNIAFRYLMQFSDVVPIPGIEKVSEIEEIFRVVQDVRPMTDEENREMQQLRDELGTSFCRRCDYCQPCSAGIPISTVMGIPSFMKRTNLEWVYGGMLDDAVAKAASCIDCGDCEERCPYHLPIRELIVTYLEQFEKGKRQYQEQKAAR